MKKNQKKANIGILTLFILGEIITFGSICLPQFVSMKENLVGFIFTLLAMHCSIICFTLSKKVFKTKAKIRIHYYVKASCSCSTPPSLSSRFSLNKCKSTIPSSSPLFLDIRARRF